MRETKPLACSPGLFFGLVALLSVPFWIAGRFTAWQLLPGVPVSAWMFVCPAAAGSILVAIRGGRGAVWPWLRQASQVSGARGLRWIAVAAAMPIVVLLAAYLSMRALGRPLPVIDMDFSRLPPVFAAFAVTGVLEQLGWSAYATRALQMRHSALASSLMVGVAWAAWHLVPLQQAGRATEWILWWCLMTIALRVLLSWLYNRSGESIAVVALCQATANTGWQFFPNGGSHYDPKIVGLSFIVLATVVVACDLPRLLAPARGDAP